MSNITETKNEMIRQTNQLIQEHCEEKWGAWPVTRKTADSGLLMYGTALTVIVGSLGVAALGPAPAPAVIGAGLAGGMASGVAVYVGHKAYTMALKAADTFLPSSETLRASIDRLKVAGATFSAAAGMNPSAKALMEESKALGTFFDEHHASLFGSEVNDQSAERMRKLMEKLIADARDHKLLAGDHTPIRVKDLEAVVRGIDVDSVNKTLHQALTLAGSDNLPMTAQCSILDALKAGKEKERDLSAPGMCSP